MTWVIFDQIRRDFSDPTGQKIKKMIFFELMQDPTPSWESQNKNPWSQQTFFSSTEYALLIFLQTKIEKLLAQLGIKPTTLDISFQSGIYDNSATATHFVLVQQP